MKKQKMVRKMMVRKMMMRKMMIERMRKKRKMGLLLLELMAKLLLKFLPLLKISSLIMQ